METNPTRIRSKAGGGPPPGRQRLTAGALLRTLRVDVDGVRVGAHVPAREVVPVTPGSEYRDALEAVRDALDIPHAATNGDDEIRARILDHRVAEALVMLRGILREDTPADVAWSAAYLRDRLAEHPAAGYETWDEAVAETRAAEDAAAEHAAAECEMCGAPGAGERLDRSVWTALADGTRTVRWLCVDRPACTGRRFPGVAAMLGGDGAR